MYQRPTTYSQLSNSNSPASLSNKQTLAQAAVPPGRGLSTAVSHNFPPREQTNEHQVLRCDSAPQASEPPTASQQVPLCPSVPPVVKEVDSASSAEKKLTHSDTLTAVRSQIKSLILNNLLTNPFFARFYVDLVISNSPNSNAAKIFRRNYKKILDRISTMPSTNTCTHIKVSGVRCGGPALRGEQFCYFHQQAHRSVRRPPFSRLHPIAIIEDEDAIQASLMDVINGLVRNTLDPKRAALILRALHIAVKNAGRVRLDSKVHTKVREIPGYAVPPEETLDPITNEGGRAVLDEEAELPAVSAKEPNRVDPQDRTGKNARKKAAESSQDKPHFVQPPSVGRAPPRAKPSSQKPKPVRVLWERAPSPVQRAQRPRFLPATPRNPVRVRK